MLLPSGTEFALRLSSDRLQRFHTSLSDDFLKLLYLCIPIAFLVENKNAINATCRLNKDKDVLVLFKKKSLFDLDI